MGILEYSLLWVMQDVYHQPYHALSTPMLHATFDALLPPFEFEVRHEL